MTFAKTVQKSRGELVYLVHGGTDHTGQPAWYFVQVEVAKVKAFQKAVDAGNVELESYGTVIESGYGKEPPHSVLEHMRKNHGYNG